MKHLFFIPVILLLFGACLEASSSDFRNIMQNTENMTHIAVISPSLITMSLSSWSKFPFLPDLLATCLNYLICLAPLTVLVIEFLRKRLFHVVLRYSLSLVFLRIAIDKFSMNIEHENQLDTIVVNNGLFNHDDKRSIAQILGYVSTYLLYIYVATILPRFFNYLLELESLQTLRNLIVSQFAEKINGFIYAIAFAAIVVILNIYCSNCHKFFDYVTNLYSGLLFDSSHSLLPSNAFQDTNVPAPIFLKTIASVAFFIMFNLISLNEAYCGIFGIFSFVAYQAALILMTTKIMYRTIYVDLNEGMTKESKRSYISLYEIMKTSSMVLLMQSFTYFIALILRLLMKIDLEIFYTCSQIVIFAALIFLDQSKSDDL